MNTTLTGHHTLGTHRIQFIARLIEHPDAFPGDACDCIVDVTPDGTDLGYQLDAVRLHSSARKHEDFGDRAAVVLHIEKTYRENPSFSRFLDAAAEHHASTTRP
ncbi:hypothetical protein [Paracidovorax wautersii]|uniref:hypothetical protein n=1 Tax=Paracidovorax wautersii TaxID=1177982 RepID=UPI0031E20DB7